MPDSPRVVVTRRGEQAAPFCDQLRGAGLTPILFPTIQLEALPARELDAALRDLERYAWLIFSSSNAVDYFFRRVKALGQAVRLPKTAVVGPATARRLEQEKIQPDFMPDSFTGEALAAGLGDLRGQEVLLPRARLGRPEIVAALQSQRAVVTEIALYDTVTAVPAQSALENLAQGYEAITFTSPSSVRGFLEICGAYHDPSSVVACIGPVTAKAAWDAGLVDTIVPEEYSAEGLVDCLTQYFKHQVPGTSTVPGTSGE